MSSGYHTAFTTAFNHPTVVLKKETDAGFAEVNERISDTRAILLDLRRRVDNLETMAGEFHCSDQQAAPTAEEAMRAYGYLTMAVSVVTVTHPELPLCSELNAAASTLRAFIEAHDE